MRSQLPIIGARARGMRPLLPVALLLLPGCSRPAPAEAVRDTAAAARTSAADPPATPTDGPGQAPQPPRGTAQGSATTSGSAAAGPGAPGKPPAPAIYGTHASIPLTAAAHGFDGHLRILEDTRARKTSREWSVPMRMSEGWLHARIELLDPAGRPVDARELWTSLADVRPAGDLRGTFFLTLDPECLGSRFCGRDTELVDVTSGKVAEVQSTDATSGRKEPIVMRDSIMEGWRAVPAERGTGLEIFQVTSRGTPSGGVTAYVRYTREGNGWIKRYKQRAGEDVPGNPGNEEEAFARAKFPALPPAKP